jgi:two-component system, OmpR family, sensor histidine kinase VicK
LPASSTPTFDSEKTEVLYGFDKTTEAIMKFLNSAEVSMNICADYTSPSVAMGVEVFKKGLYELKTRSVQSRFLTDITTENIEYCKELMQISELRHLDRIKGNFAISEKCYIASATLQEASLVQQVISSNVRAILDQQQYVFETLWNKAIPAEQKIRQIEEGYYETKLIQDNDKIINEIVRINQSSIEFSICTTAGGMQFSYNYLFEVINQLLDRQKKGEHKGIRYISSINNDNLELAKILTDCGVQLKHVKNLPPMSFGVSDKEMGATMENLEEGNAVQSLLISNEPLYIKHFASIFEELWKKGIDAADRIRDIEEGVNLAEVEVIENPKESVDRAIKISNSAKEELSILFSTPNSFHRQVQAGLEYRLREYIKRRIRVRLLIPFHEEIANTVEELKNTYPQIDFKILDTSIQTKISIVLADRKECLLVETKDDTKNNHEQAAGISIYSNSKSIVSSYISIFESLWKQTELYEQLKVNDKMQKEFINVAAHELRTPIQPILGLSEVLLSKKVNVEQYHEFVSIISRNAKRLQRLTEEILDVTKIESQSLKLNKQTFNLRNVIMSVLADHKKEDNNRGQIRLLCLNNEDIIVNADKERVTQVISNLLSNAIKFTNEGEEISVDVKRDNTAKQIDISVKDTGQGIDPEIYPRLFTKFATKSIVGTGLGLFISKKIIEAHGGKIWAENNPEGKGATFSFSLPIVEN